MDGWSWIWSTKASQTQNLQKSLTSRLTRAIDEKSWDVEWWVTVGEKDGEVFEWVVEWWVQFCNEVGRHLFLIGGK